MERTSVFERALAVAIVTLTLTVAHEWKQAPPFIANAPAIVPILLSIGAGILFPPLITSLAVNFRPFRMLALGHAWVEGTWIVRTFDSDGNRIALGIAQCDYPNPNLELRVTSYWEKGILTRSETYAASDFVYLRARDLLYVSRLTSGQAAGPVIGLATGKFQRDLSRNETNAYEGQIVFLNGTPPLRQTGQRLPRKMVKRLARQHGADWMKAALQRFGAL